MWSTSGDRGASGRVQSKGRRQIGQGAPVSCAAVMACRRIRFHAPVPVREVAMFHPLGVPWGAGKFTAPPERTLGGSTAGHTTGLA